MLCGDSAEACGVSVLRLHRLGVLTHLDKFRVECGLNGFGRVTRRNQGFFDGVALQLGVSSLDVAGITTFVRAVHADGSLPEGAEAAGRLGNMSKRQS